MTPLSKATLFHIFAIVLLAACGLVLYLPTLHYDFAFDDGHNIVENPYIRLKSLTWDSLCRAAATNPDRNRALVHLSFALNYFFAGKHPAPYRICNILIHITNGALVYVFVLLTLQVARRGTPDGATASRVDAAAKSRRLMPTLELREEALPGLAAATALLWLVHPIQTQSVTYIVQRMTSMATLFYLVALCVYIAGRRTRARPWQWLCFGFALLAGCLAMTCKQIAGTLPVVVLLYDWYFFQDLRIAWRKWHIMACAILVVLAVALALKFLGPHPFDSILVSYQGMDFTLPQRLLTEPRVIMYYISELFLPLPSRFNLDHDVTVSRSLFQPLTTAVSIALLVALFILACRWAPRHRLFSFCILWFSIQLAIESSFYGLELMYEHRLYLPSIGVALLVVLAGWRWLPRGALWRWGATAAAAALLACGTLARNPVWRNELTLWGDCLAKSPMKARVQNNYGRALMAADRLDEAALAFRRAIELDPRHFRAYNNLGTLLKRRGDVEQSISLYREALKIYPDYFASRLNLGGSLARLGRHAAAIQEFREALRLNQSSSATRYNLAGSLLGTGRLDEGIAEMRKVVELEPEHAKAWLALGRAYAAKGQSDESVACQRRAAEINPDDN